MTVARFCQETDDFPCDLESTGGLPIPMLHIHGTGDNTVPYEVALDMSRGSCTAE